MPNRLRGLFHRNNGAEEISSTQKYVDDQGDIVTTTQTVIVDEAMQSNLGREIPAAVITETSRNHVEPNNVNRVVATEFVPQVQQLGGETISYAPAQTSTLKVPAVTGHHLPTHVHHPVTLPAGPTTVPTMVGSIPQTMAVPAVAPRIVEVHRSATAMPGPNPFHPIATTVTTTQVERPVVREDDDMLLVARDLIREIESEAQMQEINDREMGVQRDNPMGTTESLVKTSVWYRQFYKKGGPLFRLQRNAYDIASWHNQTGAMTCLLIWIFCCFYPFVVPALPILGLMYYQVRCYFYKVTHHRTTTFEWIDEFERTSNLQKRKNMEDATYGIVNYCTSMDNSLRWHTCIDFSDEVASLFVMKMATLMLVVTLLVSYIVPFIITSISMGFLLSTWNTPSFRAIRAIGVRNAREWVQRNYDPQRVPLRVAERFFHDETVAKAPLPRPT